MARLQIDTGNQPGITLDVVAPNDLIHATPRSIPCVWLLHGSGGNSSDWLRFSMAEVYAARQNVFLICPSAERCSYQDDPAGDLWETRLTQQLRNYVTTLFPTLSDTPKDHFLIGCQEGAFAAAAFALKHPELYCAAACLSLPDSHVPELEQLARQYAHTGLQLHFAAARGTDTPALQQLCHTLKDGGCTVSHTVEETDDGWSFWNRQLEQLLPQLLGH